MKKLLALILAAVMLLSLAACNKEEPATTTGQAAGDPSSTQPAFPQTQNPVTFFSISLGKNDGQSSSITVFANEDGSAQLDYSGQVRKVGDLDASLFHGIAAQLEKTDLPGLNGKDAITEGQENGSLYVDFADGTSLSVTFNGTVPEAFTKGYEAMDAFFADLIADLPEYVPEPATLGTVDKALKQELDSILSGSGLEVLDSYVISQLVPDEGFAYAAGLSAAEGISAAVSFAPIMNATAYSLVIVTLEESVDAGAVCQDFEANIDWAKWVCVSADKAMIATKGNMVLCLVAADALYTQTATGITAAGWTAVKTLENT